jgi:hypothetical protein
LFLLGASYIVHFLKKTKSKKKFQKFPKNFHTEKICSPGLLRKNSEIGAKLGASHTPAPLPSRLVQPVWQELLKNAIFLQQQLKYEQGRQRAGKGRESASIYQRLSAHLTSVDIPDLTDLRDSAASRVDSAIHREPRPSGGREGGGQ